MKNLWRKKCKHNVNIQSINIHRRNELHIGSIDEGAVNSGVYLLEGGGEKYESCISIRLKIYNFSLSQCSCC